MAIKGKQTSNILYNDNDHMDAMTRISYFNTYQNTKYTKYYKPESPVMANQIMICDENGETETIWKKVYDDESLDDSHFFMMPYSNFGLSYGSNPAAIIFPSYKNITIESGPFAQFISFNTTKDYFIRSEEDYGYAVGFLNRGFVVFPSGTTRYEYLDYLPLWFSLNGLEWYEYKGFKREDAIGTKNAWCIYWSDVAVASNGVYIKYTYGNRVYTREDEGTPDYKYVDEPEYIAYIPFDKESMTFGEVRYFGESIKNVINTSFKEERQYKPEGLRTVYNSIHMYTMDDCLYGYVENRFYPSGYQWTGYQQPNNIYYRSYTFIKIDPQGNYKTFKTKYYASDNNLEIYRELIRKDNKIYYYVEKGMQAFVMTLSDELELKTIYTENIYYSTGSSGGKYPKLRYFFCGTDYSGYVESITSEYAHPFKDVSTGYYYFYAYMRYDNPVFPKVEPSGRTGDVYLKICRTKDFINYEFLNAPSYREFTCCNGVHEKLRISFDTAQPASYSIFDHDFVSRDGNSFTRVPFGCSYVLATVSDYLSINPNSSYGRGSSSGHYTNNNKIDHSKGLYFYISPQDKTPTTAEDIMPVFNHFVIYIKNFDLTPSNEDLMIGTIEWKEDPVGKEYPLDHNEYYDDIYQGLLDQLYGVGSEEG